MASALTILASILSGSVVAALVTVVMNKWSEKESRLFSAKLEVYKEFSEHLQGRFVTLVKNKDGDITTLREISSKCLLVSSDVLNKDIQKYLNLVSALYQKCKQEDFDPYKHNSEFKKLWSEGDKLAELMRKDLGFK